jgi:peptidoglycan hydrolase CwlO-like protein
MKLQEFASGLRLQELTPPMPGAAASGTKPSPLGTFAAGAAGSKPPGTGQATAPVMDPQAMAKQQAAQIKQMAERKKAIQEQIKEMQKQIQELQKELSTLK